MTATKSKPNPAKEPKPPNPLVLDAEVVGGSWRRRKLGRIVTVSKSLLTVKWDDGTTDQYGRVGQTFNGHVDADGEPTSHRGDGKDERWGDKDEPGIQIATDEAKARIAEQHAEREKRDTEREVELAQREADPAYKQRQADLAKYTEALRPHGNIENGWNDRTDFRIELDGIKAEQMERLVQAIQEVLKSLK